jgi:proline iminopeptidase
MFDISHIDNVLYPAIAPNQIGHLKVSDIHEIYYAEYGNPDGYPVVFLHGGPGAGFKDTAPRYFDPNFYRIICFDQRGAYRSKPFGELQDNTTQHLVDDMEQLRQFFGIEKWLIMGGSWGTALALAYGEAYPDRCVGFILRGICLANTDNTKNLYYDMGYIFPEAWHAFADYIPENERHDLVSSYNKRLTSNDLHVVEEAAMTLCRYDFSCMMLEPCADIDALLANKNVVIGMAKLLTHYCLNNFFMDNNTLLNNVDKISHIPAQIIHGRYDIICRIHQAYDLHKKWRNSELLVQPLAGHADVEPEILQTMIDATEKYKELFVGFKESVIPNPENNITYCC